MKFQCILHANRFEIDPYWKDRIASAVKANDGQPIKSWIETSLVESREKRRFLMGGLIPLWVCLDGNDYRDDELCERYFEDFKLEHFPEAVKIKGKIKLFGKSSKGHKMLNSMTDKIIDFLCENYGLKYESEVLNVENYKKWRDELSMSGRWEDYLAYCKELKWL